MRIKTTTLAAGPSGVIPADTEMDVPGDVGLSMIAAGHAVRVGSDEPPEAEDPEAEPAVETASLSGAENAAERIGRSDGRERAG